MANQHNPAKHSEQTLRGWMRLLRIFIYPFNFLFSLVVFLKNFSYERGLLRIQHLDRPVISIGNLSMGGTGKSPITSALADILDKQGYKTAILSRGYGRKHPKQALEVLPDSSWQETGDEPLMLRRRNPETRVFVGPSRYEAALSTSYKPDVYLIDDGFQHRQLHRDLDIVLIDCSQALPSQWAYFPFREGLNSLRRASLILLTRCHDQEQTRKILLTLTSKFPDKPILLSNFTTAPAHQYPSMEPIQPGNVIAYSGIERPSKFFNALGESGYISKFTLSLRDHQPLTKKHWKTLLREAGKHGTNTILTTEKDMVKLEHPQKDGMIVGFLPLMVQWHNPDTLVAILKDFMHRKIHEKTVKET